MLKLLIGLLLLLLTWPSSRWVNDADPVPTTEVPAVTTTEDVVLPEAPTTGHEVVVDGLATVEVDLPPLVEAGRPMELMLTVRQPDDLATGCTIIDWGDGTTGGHCPGHRCAAGEAPVLGPWTTGDGYIHTYESAGIFRVLVEMAPGDDRCYISEASTRVTVMVDVN